MLIARHQDATTTQAYLQLLKNVIENGKLTSEQLTRILTQETDGWFIGMFSEQLTMLLTQQNKAGESIGMFIVDKKDSATTQAYLQLLKNVLENGKLTSEQFTRILTQQHTNGRSIGMTIAFKQDAATTQTYLQLLKSMLESGNLTSEQLTRILTQETDGWSVGK